MPHKTGSARLKYPAVSVVIKWAGSFNELGRILEEARHSKKRTKRQVGKDTGMTVAQVERIEQGRIERLRIAKLIRMAKSIDCVIVPVVIVATPRDSDG